MNKWDQRDFPKTENRRLSVMALLQDKVSNSKILDEQRRACWKTSDSWELKSYYLTAPLEHLLYWCSPKKLFSPCGFLSCTNGFSPCVMLCSETIGGGWFLASLSSLHLWEFLLSTTLQQLLNSTFSEVLALIGIEFLAQTELPQCRGEYYFTDIPFAELSKGKLLWGYICCKEYQATCSLCASQRVHL